jgi:hypothetical protein
MTIRTDLNNRADAIFAEMQRDFAQVLSPRLSGAPLVGEAREEEAPLRNGFTPAEAKRFGVVRLENDRIILPAELAARDSGAVERGNVMYEIDRSGARPALTRVLGALGANPPAGAKQTVAEGVAAMRIEYQQGGLWRTGWKQPALPESVRVSLTLADPDRPDEVIARKAVFAVHVQ